MRLVAGVLAVALLSGCSQSLDGSAQAGSKAVDPGALFAGGVPTYGQPVDAAAHDRLVYLQAVRRVDPCGLLTRDALAKVGEIISVGTLFVYNECDVDLKVPGVTADQFASVEVVAGVDGRPGVFDADGLPVFEAYPGSCDYELPLDLSHATDAPSSGPVQWLVRLSMISDEDCGLVRRLVQAVAPTLVALRLPVRDALATYPAAAAEHDPCQVLSTLGDRIAGWDVANSEPFACHVTLHDGSGERAVQVSLAPRADDANDGSRVRTEHDGAEVFLEPKGCTATTFVGAPMRRKVVGGDYLGVGDVVIRPAVVVRAGAGGCDTAVDVASAAAKLYA